MELSKVDSMATVNDVSTASDVSDPRHPASGSPTLSAATSKLSPQRSRLMKDQETVRGGGHSRAVGVCQGGAYLGCVPFTLMVCHCVCVCVCVCLYVCVSRCVHDGVGYIRM